MNQFGNIVKHYLVDVGLSQQFIADKMGISRSSISQFLSHKNISLDKMQAISEALGCDLEIKLIPKNIKR